MKKPTNIKNAPADATHWAPEQDEWTEAYYRKDRDGLWYCVNDYWASDVDQRPHGFAAQAWRKKPIYPLSKMRPLDHLILIDTFIEEAVEPTPKGLTVTLPVDIMMNILTKPAKGEEWMRNAAREYAHREIKKLFPKEGEWK